MPISWNKEQDGLEVCRVRGTLTWDEFSRLQESLVPEQGLDQKVNTLVLLEDFEGWDDSEHWGELRYVERNDAVLGKMAIVGDERWRDQMEMFTLKGLRPVDIEYFGSGELDLARLWLKTP